MPSVDWAKQSEWHGSESDEDSDDGEFDGTWWDPEQKWERARNGEVPPNAFMVGFDLKYRGMFVCSGYMKGDQTPGKVVPASDFAHVPFDGQELDVYNYFVLCGDKNDFEWRQTNGDRPIPERAVKGGMTKDGEAMYIGRVNMEGADVVGKVIPSRHTCLVPFNGEEHAHFAFEILVARNSTTAHKGELGLEDASENALAKR